MQISGYLDGERQLLLAEITDHLSNSEWDLAYQTMILRCDDAPNSGPAWELRGLIESHLSLHYEAIQSLEYASLLNPLDPLASRCLALEYMGAGKRELGIDLLISLASGVRSPEFIRLISHDLLQVGACEASFKVVSEALTRVESALLWHELSATLSKMRRPAHDALAAALQAATMEPDAASYRVTAATLYISLDEPEEAYALVRYLSEDSIRRLDCACCLWRLICIFDCFESYDLLRVCYEQWASSQCAFPSVPR